MTSPTDSPSPIQYYWRPGCPFCSRLEAGLDKLGLPLNKHNIWDDPAHAATVRSIANGNETVPTLIIGEAAMVNPTVDEVVEALAGVAPELVPADWEPRKKRFGR